MQSKPSFLSRIIEAFLQGNLAILLIIISLLVGAAALYVTPREEEPQIVVPMADIYVKAPGANPAEIEKLVASPLERLLWQIDGVEYVYSVSSQDMAVVTVRFYVGQERENSILKIHNRIAMNQDIVPPIVQNWVVKPIEIDDVPIVNLTLFSDRYNDHELRRMGEEVLARLSTVKDISRTQIVGGDPRLIVSALVTGRQSRRECCLIKEMQDEIATDVAGNNGAIGDAVPVIVNNRPLTVSITAPASGSRGSMVQASRS